jgi:Mce-associated membrane protein
VPREAGSAARATHRAPSHSRYRRYPVAVLTVAAAALAASTGWLAVLLHEGMTAQQRRAAVLAAARQEAVSLTTLSSRTGARALDAALAVAGGSLKQQLSQGRAALLGTLRSASVRSAGVVLDAGIATMGPRTATVLLNVRATVRSKQTHGPETRLYHWRAGLVLSDGRWLVTSLEFV